MNHALPRDGTQSEPGIEPDDTAVLTIDLDALAANYRHLRDLAAPAECAAVVKADAYGIGVAYAAPALWRAGCKTFFVATLTEAEALRGLLPEAVIYVFGGLLPGTAETFHELGVRPVLNSVAEIREWAGYCARTGEKLPCAVHIDSGMNRLGLPAPEVDAVAQAQRSLVGSHSFFGDEPPRLRRRSRPRQERTPAAHLRRLASALA